MDDIKITERTIDVEKVFREKSPSVARLLPGFVFSYLRRIIHESEINEFLYTNRDKVGLEFVDALLDSFQVTVKVEGAENLKKDGRYIVASNHPLGGLDGVALMQAAGRIREDIVFPVNDILMFLPNLQPLFIPINKHGSNAQNLKIIQDTFAADKLVLFFPAGLVSRKVNGQITDLEWKKTFISRATKFKRDIVPTFIDGTNSSFFYRLANIRKNLGIKANIEMLYLPNEMFKQRNKTLNIRFGKPISHETFDTKKGNYNQWADRVKQHVYRLGKEADIDFNY